jgi:drug/metabolite transporter (DMT)-like permease
MGDLDKQPAGSGTDQSRQSEEVLREFTQELRELQHKLLLQLTQDVERLGAEKSRLVIDIDRLQAYRQRLQAQQTRYLARRPVDPAMQQWAQQWAKQTAQHMGSYLQTVIVQRFNELEARIAAQPGAIVPRDQAALAAPPNRYLTENTDRTIASIDATLTTLFQSLQRDINTYESDLSQRLSRMNDLEQRGEAILDALVARLVELQDTTPHGNQLPAGGPAIALPTPPLATPPPPTPTNGTSTTAAPGPTLPPRAPGPSAPGPGTPGTHPPQPASALVPRPSPAPTTPKGTPNVQLGLFLALLSAVALSVFNVSLKVILQGANPDVVLGIWEMPGLITPGLGNSLLILLLRMVVVMLVFPILATILYPATWTDIRRLLDSQDTAQMMKVAANGFFLFLSQVLIYIAIGEIPTGVAITIFFIYPIITILASWPLFGDRPTLFRLAIMAVIGIGGILALPSFTAGASGNVVLGTLAAAGSGVAFAGYILSVQMGTKSMHPIPFTLLSFLCILFLSGITLVVRPGNFAALDIDPTMMIPLVVGGIWLGLLTLSSYLLNNIAVRNAGAALAAIVGTTGPAMTALFGWLLISETLTLTQIMGMTLVTLGVFALSAERMLAQRRNKA